MVVLEWVGSFRKGKVVIYIKSIIEQELGRVVVDVKFIKEGILVLCDDGFLCIFTHIIGF